MQPAMQSHMAATDLQTDSPRPILCVGLLCLDIVNTCDSYPGEDEDVRARAQQWRPGGNAANSSIVLSLIGRQCEFLGTLGRGMETESVSDTGEWEPEHAYAVV